MTGTSGTRPRRGGGPASARRAGPGPRGPAARPGGEPRGGRRGTRCRARRRGQDDRRAARARTTSCSSSCPATGRSPGRSCVPCSASSACRCRTPTPRSRSRATERGTITPFGPPPRGRSSPTSACGARRHPRRRCPGVAVAVDADSAVAALHAQVADVTEPEPTAREAEARPPGGLVAATGVAVAWCSPAGRRWPSPGTSPPSAPRC